jgi:hypothetical protein
MGNAASPIINKSGSIQPWNKIYYSNKLLRLRLKQSSNFLLILNLHLLYSNNFKSHPFLSNFWYKKAWTSRRLAVSSPSLFFKRKYYSNSILGIEHSFLIRRSTKELFSFSARVLLYSQWFIFIITWFKPQKNNKLSSKNSSTANRKFSNSTSRHGLSPANQLERYSKFLPNLTYTF